MGYPIRHYRHSDCPALARIYCRSIRHLGRAHYTREQIAAWSSFPQDREAFQDWLADATTMVAVDDNTGCIGFGGLGDEGRVSAIFTAPERMRRGIGSALLRCLLGVARSRGITRVTVEASEFSKPLFEKFGFRVTEIEHTRFKGVEFERYAMQGSMPHIVRAIGG